MEILNTLKELFAKKKSLDKIDYDDLRRERIRMEQIEQRINKEIDEIEKRKQGLFAKGKDEASQRQQIALARKIKELDVGVRAKDRQLAMISKQLRILSGLTTLKENEKMSKELGVSSIISTMDIEELQGYVEKATIEGQFQMERFAHILKTMEGSDLGEIGEGEEADTLAIVAAMQEAKDAEANDPDVAIKSGLKQVEEILRSGDEKELNDPEQI